MLTAVRADLSDQSVAYERFLIFDDDIRRYLWDGHVAGPEPALVNQVSAYSYYTGVPLQAEGAGHIEVAKLLLDRGARGFAQLVTLECAVPAAERKVNA